MKRVVILLLTCALGAHSTLEAQSTYALIGSGRMLYDADNDHWHQTYLLGLGRQVATTARVGVMGTYTPVPPPAAVQTSFGPAGSEQYSRVLAFVQWDAARFGNSASRTPSLFLTGGFGVVHTSGHYVPDLEAGALRYQMAEQRTGLSAMGGAGLRVPIVARVALEGGLDFQYDQLLGEGLRNWTWNMGVAFAP